MSQRIQQYQSYDKDFYAWAMDNAKLLRQKKLSQIDVEHIAEELESMGRSDKRKLVSRLAVLLTHLLKWQYQPQRRTNSWKYTIEEQRIKVCEVLDESPSLNHELERNVLQAYKRAVLIAAKETMMNVEKFPQICPFVLSQAIKYDFFPE
jgi:hypothetical protein